MFSIIGPSAVSVGGAAGAVFTLVLICMVRPIRSSSPARLREFARAGGWVRPPGNLANHGAPVPVGRPIRHPHRIAPHNTPLYMGRLRAFCALQPLPPALYRPVPVAPPNPSTT